MKKNLLSQKVINFIISLTGSTHSLDSILQDFVELLTQELNTSYCLIRSFPQKNIYYPSSLSELNQVFPFILEIANQIIDHQQIYLSQGQYLIQSSDTYVSELTINLPKFTIIVFPMIYKNKYLGNLFFYQKKDDYQWTLDEINLGKFTAFHSAIALYQEQLERENNSLKQEKNLIEQIAYISHELRTPISAIVGFSKILLKEIYGSLNLKQKDYLIRIVSSGEYLLALVNDLLDLFKLNLDQQELILTEIDLDRLCHQALMMIEEQAKRKSLDVVLVMNTKVTTIKADQICLLKILINLLSNSVKFTEKGAITLKVSVDNKQLLFAVIDTGIGIKKEDKVKLFKPFQQISNNLNNLEKGTGLGLALSQKLAHLHGGEITCFSEVNRGSCFTLSLPIFNES